MPSQAVAVAAFNDEAHVIENRRLYDAKYAAAEHWLAPLFGPVTPPGGFFLWLDVARFGGGVAATERLWREAGVRVVPGGFLAADGPDSANPGAAYIRLALVETLEITETALARVAETFR
jgi:aspartate/methionine/tyrosine aminotransferase